MVCRPAFAECENLLINHKAGGRFVSNIANIEVRDPTQY